MAHTAGQVHESNQFQFTRSIKGPRCGQAQGGGAAGTGGPCAGGRGPLLLPGSHSRLPQAPGAAAGAWRCGAAALEGPCGAAAFSGPAPGGCGRLSVPKPHLHVLLPACKACCVMLSRSRSLRGPPWQDVASTHAELNRILQEGVRIGYGRAAGLAMPLTCRLRQLLPLLLLLRLLQPAATCCRLPDTRLCTRR